jgi:hypothetical protein
MLRWYASLVAERHRHPDLTDDQFDSISVETGDSDAGSSWPGGLRVVANLTANRRRPGDRPGPDRHVVLAWDRQPPRIPKGS